MCNRVVPCCKNTILSHFIQFQHYGEKDTLAYREMKLLLSGCSGAGGTINWGGRVPKKFFLPGGSGVGGIMNWGGRVQKKFFLPGGSGAGGIISWGGRVQNHFSDLTFFFDFEFKNTSNLIFPGFKVPSESFQGFQNRVYFLAYVILRIEKLSPKLSTYWWDTLYIVAQNFVI